MWKVERSGHEFGSSEQLWALQDSNLLPCKGEPGGFRKPSEQGRIGHASVSMILDVYSHAIPAMHEEAAEMVAGLIVSG